MGNRLTYGGECSTYPGKYTPLPELDELSNDKRKCMTQPPLNIDEFDNFFMVEVSLPGIHRQDIIVFVEDNILTNKVIHKESNAFTSKPRIHEFDMNYFERQISLPDNADI
jgi:HSP20 family molecular chaperone IbpA